MTQLHYAVFLFANQGQVYDAYLSVTGEEKRVGQPYPLLWRKTDSPGNVPPHSAWMSWNCTDEDWIAFLDAIPNGINNNPNFSVYTEENWTPQEVLDDETRKNVGHKRDDRIGE